MIINLDHDQLEPRIQAHIYSGLGDDTWSEVYHFQEEWRKKHPEYPEGKDWNPRADIYSVVGHKVYRVKLASIDSKKHPIRDKSKPVVLGMSYGLTEYGLAWRIGTGIEEAKEIITTTFNECPGMKKYYIETREELLATESIQTMFGLNRRLPFKHHKGENRKWQFKRAFRQAVNVKIQGPASDMTISGITDFEEKYLGLDMIRVIRGPGEAVFLVAEVHDSGVYDMMTTDLLPSLKWHMMNPSILEDYGITLRVPLFVDEKRGETWS